MKKTIIVIHHSADFDGIFCREIAKRILGESAEYIGWDYGDHVPYVPPGVRLYMLDISIESLMDHPRLIWIDHHKTAIQKFDPFIAGFRMDGVAACRLTWQWFFGDIGAYQKEAYIERNVSEPLAVRLAGEYDIWDKRDPNAELFQHGLKSRYPDYTSLLNDDREYVNLLLEGGKALQYARKNEYEQVIKEQGFTVSFEGLTFLACNSHELDIRSHLFEAGIRPEHDGLLGFTWNGVSGDWRVSLYGVPGKPDIDLSVIAVKYGGGGHKQACGFRCATLPFELRPYESLK